MDRIDYRDTTEGKIAKQKYADILFQSRPEPSYKHPRMDLQNRAKIFSPFAALRGYDEEIAAENKDSLLAPKLDMSEESKEALGLKLKKIQKGMVVSVSYFAPSKKLSENSESLGTYINVEGTVSQIDFVYQRIGLMVDTEVLAGEKFLPTVIPFGDILDISEKE